MNRRGMAVVLGVLAWWSGAVWSAPLMEKFEQTYPVPADAEITVRNTDGTIYIYASEENELKIVARTKAYSRERLDAISVQVSIQGSKATIDTKFPPRPKGLSLHDRSGTVDYVIVVPQRCTLAQVELTTGEILVEGL